MAEISEEKKCAYNFVGKSGLKVSNLCMGALTFGGNSYFPGHLDEGNSQQLLDRYVEWGGNFIDTANVYGSGRSEDILGRWLEKRPRDDIVLATKVRYSMGTDTDKNNEGLSRRHITASIDNSLKRLKTDYVDLYQTHAFDNGTKVEETYRTLDDLVRIGKVRYVGLSNVTGWQIQKIVETTKQLGLNPIISLQQQYNLLCRESEIEPFQVCKNEGLGVLSWSPLRGGVLTGKIKRGQAPVEGSRMQWIQDNKEAMPSMITQMVDFNYDLLEQLDRISKAKGRSVAQISLRWLIQKDVVSSTIIGAMNLTQLDDNMAASNGWSLSKEEMEELDKLSQLPMSYPYNMIFNYQQRVNKRAYDYFVESTY